MWKIMTTRKGQNSSLFFSSTTLRTLVVQILTISSSVLVLASSTPQQEALVSELKPKQSTNPEVRLSNHEFPYPKFKSFYTQCDKIEMKIFINFDSNFTGRIYASDYADDRSCGVNAVNNTSENVNFTLPLEQCGVQMTTSLDDTDNNNSAVSLNYDLILYIQYSAFVQQVVDQKILIYCTETRPPLEDNISQHLEPEEQQRSSRQGRFLKGKSLRSTPRKSAEQIGEALMEIISGKDPSPKSKKIVPVFVGEDVTLVISTKVIRGFDARIVNCTVHDGSRTTNDGSRVQQILDSAGCSIDRGLVPNFRRRRLPVESRNRLITLHFASFPAFKFPERDHIHMKCSVAFCEGPCPQESCQNGLNHFGSWKDKYGGRIADVLIDTMEVGNSLQVLAPNLEDPGGHHYERHQSSLAFGSANAAASSLPPTPLSSVDQTHRHQKQFSDTPKAFPTSSFIHSSSMSALSAAASARSLNNNNNNFYHDQVGDVQQSIYNRNNHLTPQMMTTQPNLSSVCISPGTLILVLVILGVVLVISASATLWFALRRSEAKKYARQKQSVISSYASSGSHSPSPYYRFSHW